MSELRWTLLILGVVFIAALSWWERRRPRQAFAPRLRESGPGREGEARGAERPDGVPGPGEPSPPERSRVLAEFREPWIGDTDLSGSVLTDVALGGAAASDEPAGGAARTRPDAASPRPLQELPTLVIPDEGERMALQAAWDAAPPEPLLIDPLANDAEETGTPAAAPERPPAPPASDSAPPEEGESPEAEAGPPAARADTTAGRAESRLGAAANPDEAAAPPGKTAAAVSEAGPRTASAPIVDWPPEASRRILALRLVASLPDRFPGRALRLALAAEGFLLGEYSIFHKPDDSNRAVLSAASLTRPGAFDLEAMDAQRYAGLSLFAVLPGPSTPARAFEELLATARNLNERLQGALQDEHGGPLTPLRVASIRESLKAEPADPPAAAAHEA